MGYPWIDEYCLAKKGATKDYKVEWRATRYMINNKMFAMQCADKEGKSIITVKLEPMFGQMLRSTYKDIVPGYYMNKEHWNSLYLEGRVPDEVLEDMLDKSYQIIFGSLSKKAQNEIIGVEQK